LFYLALGDPVRCSPFFSPPLQNKNEALPAAGYVMRSRIDYLLYAIAALPAPPVLS